MSAWWDRMVAFDTETTGVDPETSRIVTASVIEVEAGSGVVDARSWLVNPGVSIEPGATEVHGITNEKAQADGDDAPFAVADIIGTIADALTREPGPLVAMNARFDLTLLDREARRYGVAPLTERAAVFVVDPYVIDRFLDQYRRGQRTLSHLCEHYGVPLDDAHDADADALATARLAWKMCSKGEVAAGRYGVPQDKHYSWLDVRENLGALHTAQTRWAEDQAFGLADYFRRKGEHEKADGVRAAWPLVPFEQAAAA